MPEPLSWTDIDDIVLALDEAHPQVDPLTVRFTQLKHMIESLPDFQAEPGQNANEQILEAIQAGWHEEREASGVASPSREDEEKERKYKPNEPFRA